MIKVFDYSPVFNKTVLDNGVVIVTEHHPNTRATCASIFVKVGSRDEIKKLNGCAHFLEHLVFKGTKKRTALQIAQSLESVGGELNAYTTREFTCFHTSSLREDLGLSIDVLVDLIAGASMVPKEFAVEKDVVLQEIDMCSEQFEEYIFDLYFEKVFDKDRVGQPILGTEKSINNMSRPDVLGFYKNYYRGQNLIVSVAGDVKHDDVVKMVKAKLGRTKGLKPKKRIMPKHKSYVEHISKPSEQLHVLMGFPAVSYKNKHRFESYMINAILGGGMTSRLYQKIREKKGWAYSVYSYLHSFEDTGVLNLYAGTQKSNYKQVIGAFYDEIEKLHKKGVKKSELEFFKKQVIGAIILGADDIESRMTSIAVNEMVFGNYRPIETVVSEIEKVTTESIDRYIDKYLDLNNVALLTLGDK